MSADVHFPCVCTPNTHIINSRLIFVTQHVLPTNLTENGCIFVRKRYCSVTFTKYASFMVTYYKFSIQDRKHPWYWWSWDSAAWSFILTPLTRSIHELLQVCNPCKSSHLRRSISLYPYVNLIVHNTKIIVLIFLGSWVAVYLSLW